MATRALIGTIESDAAGNIVLTSTYNHYDGYPENLGKGLNDHYSSEDKAIEISNKGYISYLNPETGEIDAKHKEPAGKDILPDEFEEAMSEVHSIADSSGADYIYLYDWQTGNWLDSRNYSTKNLISAFAGTSIDYQFDGYEGGDLADEDSIGMMEKEDKIEDKMEENYKTKWESFITENQAIDDQWVAYVKSLVNDIRLNGIESYTEYTEDDFKEDFDNYVSDKTSM